MDIGTAKVIITGGSSGIGRPRRLADDVAEIQADDHAAAPGRLRSRPRCSRSPLRAPLGTPAAVRG